ncbi:MAG: acyl-CoA dehydrogenase family protein [Bacteroidia bacterium]
MEDVLFSPTTFLETVLGIQVPHKVRQYENWWKNEAMGLSQTIDSAGTPWLQLYDAQGKRIDKILFPHSYRYLLDAGYAAGVVWEAHQGDLLTGFLLGYVCSYFDPGLYCPYVVTLSTWAPLYKYGSQQTAGYLAQLVRREAPFYQGATWMTERGSGSDLGSYVATTAYRRGDTWYLSGEKYFASNVGADMAVVAARAEGAPPGVRGLSLFLVPRYNANGELNYFIQRLKNKIGTRSVPTGEVVLSESEAYQIGTLEIGIYLILEVLNFSRVANSIGSMALAQHALAQAWSFASQRKIFGSYLTEHPLWRAEWERHYQVLCEGAALAWLSESWLRRTWHEKPPYSVEYGIFRLLTHLAKFWTAQKALEITHWNMETWGGLGILAEFPPERFLREALILPIWEGTRHRHILDAWELFQRKRIHTHLWELYPIEEVDPLLFGEIEDTLRLDKAEQEIRASALLSRLAQVMGMIAYAAKTKVL